MLLVHHVEGVGRKVGKLRMRRKAHPSISGDRRQAWTDPSHDFHLLLDRIDIGGARFRAVAEKQLGGRANEPHHHDPHANIRDRVVRVLHVDAQVRLDAVPQERASTGPAKLVSNDGCHQNVALKPNA